MVSYRIGIEDDQVREIAGTKISPFREFQIRRREGCQPPDRFGQREKLSSLAYFPRSRAKLPYARGCGWIQEYSFRSV